MDQVKIGAYLKELRKERNLTQEQLAEELNVSNRTVSRWETGSNMPDISLLIDIAEFYDVSIAEIIDAERRSEEMNEEVNEAGRKVAEYSEEKKARLLRTALIICGVGVIAQVLNLIFTIFNDTDFYTHIQGSHILSFLNGFFPGVALGALIVALLYISGVLFKIKGNEKSARIAKTIAIIVLIICFAIIVYELLIRTITG